MLNNMFLYSNVILFQNYYLILNQTIKCKVMAAPKGNQFWKLRSKHGRDKLFATPELMWEAACEYFQWCESHPLYETKAFAFQGIVTTKKLPVMRAMTLSQLCFYLNCNEEYFRQFKHSLSNDEQDFSRVIHDIEKTIYNQKFQGASGNLLNANIIARDLGLKEGIDTTATVYNSTPLTPEEIKKAKEGFDNEL